MPLGNTLGDEGDGLDLREPQDVQGRSVDRSAGRKVDDDVGVLVLLDGLFDRGVDGQEGLLGTPVELLNVVSSEGVDHGSDRGGLSATREVKVEHSLDSTGLETKDERSGVLIERPVRRSTGDGVPGSVLERDDVVAGLVSGPVGLDGTETFGSVRDGRRGLLTRLELLGDRGDGRLGLVRLSLDSESHGDNVGDVGLGTKDLDLDAERLSEETHGLETFLVVGTTSSDKDPDLVSDQGFTVLFEGSDDSLESGGDVGKVGDTSSDDEQLALRVGLTPGDEVDDGLGVLVRLTLGGGTRVFTIVGELVSEPGGSDGVRVDDRGTTSSDHGPDSSFGVEDGELERSTGRSVELLDPGLLLGQVSTERSGPDHGRTTVGLDAGSVGSGGSRGVTSDGPLGSTEEVGSLVELGGHVEVVDLRSLSIDTVHADQGVDLEVGD